MNFTDQEMVAIYRKKILNQELSLEEFRMRKLILESMPSKVMLELYSQAQGKHRIMPHDIWEKCATQLFPLAYDVDLRGFGANQDTHYWHKILKECAMYPLTNWHYVTYFEHPLKEFWDQIFKLGFMINFISIATNEKTFDSLQNDRSFKTVAENMDQAAMAQKKNNYGYFAITVQLEPGNLHELPEFIDMAKNLGVTDVYVRIKDNQREAVTGYSEQIQLATLVEKTIKKAIDAKVRLKLTEKILLKGVDPNEVKRAETVPVNVTIPFPLPAEKDESFSRKHPWLRMQGQLSERTKVAIYKRCFKPLHFAHVDPDGIVGPCSFMLEPEIHPMGDLKKTSFKEIWNGESYQFFRASLFFKKAQDVRCRWCFENRVAD